MNTVILIGRVGRDPELKYTTSGKSVCNFTLATSEKWRDADGNKQESTTWHNIVAWGRPAEIIKEYVTKGKLLAVVGKIDNRSYDDKDGNKKYISEVVVKEFEFLGGGKEAQASASEVPPGVTPVNNDDDPDMPF